MKLAVVTINIPSANSAIELKKILFDFEIDIYAREDSIESVDGVFIYSSIDELLQNIWKKYDGIICILAIGIIIRKIAPLLKSKTEDPAVIAMSLNLLRVVPLLSGHIGGANSLSTLIASRIKGCVNFISTATDQVGAFAFDMFAKENSMKIENISKLANISNRLINNQEVKVVTYKKIFQNIENRANLKLALLNDIDVVDNNSVLITPFGTSTALHLKPKISLGIGCNRNTTFKELQSAFLELLQTFDLELEDIRNLASFEIKRDEDGLLELAKNYNLGLLFFTKEDINALSGEFSTSQASRFFGLKGVSEPSSILASRFRELVIQKRVYDNKITIAGAI